MAFAPPFGQRVLPHFGLGAPPLGGGMFARLFGTGGATAPVAPGVAPPQPQYPGIKTPGFTPDYNSDLSNDPGLMAVRNNNQFSLAQAAAERDAAIKGLNYGYSGSRFGTLEQLARQLKETLFLGDKGLAARGALHSGETPWLHEHAQYAHDLQNYDASRALASAMASAQKGYLGVAQGNASSEAQAISDAAQRMADNPIHQPTEGFAAHAPDIGPNVYRDLSGKLWTLDANGNTVPYTGPIGNTPVGALAQPGPMVHTEPGAGYPGGK